MPRKFSGVDALKEHMLSGERVTTLEANALFGVQSPTGEITRLRQQGFLVKRQTVPLARVIRRLNQHCNFTPPKDLPIIELSVSEWWISID